MMDRLAQKASDFFGSAPFILFHIVWFSTWAVLHFTIHFDPDWKILTLLVSLEAIFLTLFVLRAETIQSRQQHKDIRQDLKKSDKVLEKLEEG